MSKGLTADKVMPDAQRPAGSAAVLAGHGCWVTQACWDPARITVVQGSIQAADHGQLQHHQTQITL